MAACKVKINWVLLNLTSQDSWLFMYLCSNKHRNWAKKRHIIILSSYLKLFLQVRSKTKERSSQTSTYRRTYGQWNKENYRLQIIAGGQAKKRGRVFLCWQNRSLCLERETHLGNLIHTFLPKQLLCVHSVPKNAELGDCVPPFFLNSKYTLLYHRCWWRPAYGWQKGVYSLILI